MAEHRTGAPTQPAPWVRTCRTRIATAGLVLASAPCAAGCGGTQPESSQTVTVCPQTVRGPINLPADDAAHPYTPASVEWWYWTSHLRTGDGREFGFAHIVYTALFPVDPSNPSNNPPVQWVDTTITDVAARSYHFGGRQFASQPAKVVPDGFEFDFESSHVSGGGGKDEIQAVVDDGGASYSAQLKLESTKTPVVHMAGGNVNYYSRERMTTKGTLVVDGETLQVTGETWFDHQFGDQQIDLATVRYWTWIAVQLNDNRELYVLLLDKQDDSRLLSAALSSADCKTTEYSADEITVAPRSTWTPPESSCEYPMGWNIRIPAAGQDLRVDPFFESQDIFVSGQDHYWEGDAAVSGTSSGRAYAELYGYCPF